MKKKKEEKLEEYIAKKMLNALEIPKEEQKMLLKEIKKMKKKEKKVREKNFAITGYFILQGLKKGKTMKFISGTFMPDCDGKLTALATFTMNKRFKKKLKTQIDLEVMEIE